MTMTRRDLLSAGLVGGSSLILTNGHMANLSTGENNLKPEASAPNSVKVQIVIYHDVAITDALAPYDVLTTSALLGTRFETNLITLDNSTEVVSFNGLTLKPTEKFDPSADILFVPGSGGLTWQTLQPQGLSKTLQSWHQAGKLIVSDCTGAIFVGEAGLLKGRNATTHHGAQATLQKAGATIIPARVVDDGDIITSGGVTSGIDLALYLIERFYGAPLAVATEQLFEFERRGVVWRAKA